MAEQYGMHPEIFDVVQRLRKCKDGLLAIQKQITDQNRAGQLYEVLEEIDHYLNIISDINAAEVYSLTMLRNVQRRIFEIMRENPLAKKGVGNNNKETDARNKKDLESSKKSAQDDDDEIVVLETICRVSKEVPSTSRSASCTSTSKVKDGPSSSLDTDWGYKPELRQSYKSNRYEQPTAFGHPDIGSSRQSVSSTQQETSDTLNNNSLVHEESSTQPHTEWLENCYHRRPSGRQPQNDRRSSDEPEVVAVVTSTDSKEPVIKQPPTCASSSKEQQMTKEPTGPSSSKPHVSAAPTGIVNSSNTRMPSLPTPTSTFSMPGQSNTAKTFINQMTKTLGLTPIQQNALAVQMGLAAIGLLPPIVEPAVESFRTSQSQDWNPASCINSRPPAPLMHPSNFNQVRFEGPQNFAYDQQQQPFWSPVSPHQNITQWRVRGNFNNYNYHQRPNQFGTNFRQKSRPQRYFQTNPNTNKNPPPYRNQPTSSATPHINNNGHRGGSSTGQHNIRPPRSNFPEPLLPPEEMAALRDGNLRRAANIVSNTKGPAANTATQNKTRFPVDPRLRKAVPATIQNKNIAPVPTPESSGQTPNTNKAETSETRLKISNSRLQSLMEPVFKIIPLGIRPPIGRHDAHKSVYEVDYEALAATKISESSKSLKDSNNEKDASTNLGTQVESKKQQVPLTTNPGTGDGETSSAASASTTVKKNTKHRVYQKSSSQSSTGRFHFDFDSTTLRDDDSHLNFDSNLSNTSHSQTIGPKGAQKEKTITATKKRMPAKRQQKPKPNKKDKSSVKPPRPPPPVQKTKVQRNTSKKVVLANEVVEKAKRQINQAAKKCSIMEPLEQGKTRVSKRIADLKAKELAEKEAKKKAKKPPRNNNISAEKLFSRTDNIIGVHDIIVNPGLGKIKMESDYVDTIKLEPMMMVEVVEDENLENFNDDLMMDSQSHSAILHEVFGEVEAEVNQISQEFQPQELKKKKGKKQKKKSNDFNNTEEMLTRPDAIIGGNDVDFDGMVSNSEMVLIKVESNLDVEESEPMFQEEQEEVELHQQQGDNNPMMPQSNI